MFALFVVKTGILTCILISLQKIRISDKSQLKVVIELKSYELFIYLRQLMSNMNQLFIVVSFKARYIGLMCYLIYDINENFKSRDDILRLITFKFEGHLPRLKAFMVRVTHYGLRIQ